MRTENKKYPAFTDTDKMPFGKFKGLELQDVPATYLAFLYESGGTNNIMLNNYIWNSKEAIEQEIGGKLL